MIQPLVYILSDNFALPTISKLQSAYEGNGYRVKLQTVDSLLNENEVANLLIADLDSLEVKDIESFIELMADMASRNLIICSESFQRLLYYKDLECYTSVDNLLEREFFAYATS